MPEFCIIQRNDTDQYYHSLTHTGAMLWVDNKDQARWLTYIDAEKLIDRVNGGDNPKYYQLEIKVA